MPPPVWAELFLEFAAGDHQVPANDGDAAAIDTGRVPVKVPLRDVECAKIINAAPAMADEFLREVAIRNRQRTVAADATAEPPRSSARRAELFVTVQFWTVSVPLL